jgi:biotin carboxyl carrier protein
VARESLLLQFGERTFRATRELSPEGAVQISLGNDAEFQVIPLENSDYRVSQQNTQGNTLPKQAICVAADHHRWVFLDGEVFLVEVRGQSDVSRRPAAGAASLTAPMPATVIKIMVAPGDHVKKGQTLLVLEAMKMEMPVKAPVDGIVKKVNCGPNQLVQPDVQLLELE